MKLWVTAGGTGSAWHIASVVKEYFKNDIELYISDINDRELVASASLADHFFKVPKATEEGYADYMYGLLEANSIDAIIPLIPWEQSFFSADNERFNRLGIKTAAPDSKLDDSLNNKQGLYGFCCEHGIPTIEIYNNVNFNSIDPNADYFVKPINGFGAVGAERLKGNQITADILSERLLQEYCPGPEITVEVFNGAEGIRTIARQRIEAKSGVCTKAKILHLPELDDIIRQFTNAFRFPTVFNIQFIQKDGQWKVMDINLRLAAGTGISKAAGFQLVRAYLLTLLEKPVTDELFAVDRDIVSVLRVYQEVVIR